jgi:hypothetical protein
MRMREGGKVLGPSLGKGKLTKQNREARKGSSAKRVSDYDKQTQAFRWDWQVKALEVLGMIWPLENEQKASSSAGECPEIATSQQALRLCNHKTLV